MKKIIFSLFSVAFIFLAAASYAMGSESGSVGPVAFWHFDENSGTVTQDVSGTNPGTLTNGTQWTSGKFGAALSFDGIDDGVSVSSSQNSQIKDLAAFTFTAWIFPTEGGIIFRKSALTPAPYNISITKGTNEFSFRSGFTTQTGVWRAQNPISLNTWHQIAVAYTKNVNAIPSLYVDGIQQGITQRWFPYVWTRTEMSLQMDIHSPIQMDLTAPQMRVVV